MCLYFLANPLFAKKRQAHKKFRIALVYQLAQQFLNERENTESYNYPQQQEERGKRKTSDYTWLTGKHYAVSKYPIKKKCSSCAYRVNKVTKKKLGTQTCNFCPKCNAYICKRCFKDFHTNSKV